MSYKAVFDQLFINEGVADQKWFQQNFSQKLFSFTDEDVEKALLSAQGNLNALQVLLSPAAEKYLEEMAQISSSLTRQRFGANIHLFVPLYLSNLCANECDYCGFSMSNKIKRKVLNSSEISAEINVLKTKGFDSVLLVTGEHKTKVGIDYFEQVLPQIKKQFSYLAIEVQPMEQSDYRRLADLGLDAVMVYQETYCKQTYGEHHLRGNKQDFYYRLETPERIARAGVDKIGLGILLGLTDWRIDAWLMGHHLAYLQQHHWRSRYSLSVPRLRPCTGGVQPKSPVNDRQLLQMICAFRLFNPELEISLSTRESPTFRNGVFPLGITNISAESSTEPGGYAKEDQATNKPHLAQFETSDNRSLLEVSQSLSALNLQPVLKDWQREWSMQNRLF